MAAKGNKRVQRPPRRTTTSRRRTTKRRRRLEPPPSPRRGSLRLGLLLLVLVGFNVYYLLYRDGTSIPDVMERAALAGEMAKGDDIIDLEGELGPAAPGDGTAIEEAAPEDDPDYTVSGEVGSGDSITTILVRHGIGQSEAHAVITAMTGHLEFKHIHAGQKYRLRFDSSGAMQELEYRVNRVEAVRVTRGDDGSLSAVEEHEPTEIKEVEVGGKITSSLYQSIKDAGEDTRLVAFFVDVFAYDLNFYVDTHPGDSFRMVIEKEYLHGDFLRYGRILAAEYRGLEGTYRAIRFELPGEDAEYFNEKGESVAKTFLKTPLKYTRISSKYNPHRMHPVLHRRRGHWGVDYAAPRGTPIRAAAAGKIVFRGRRGGAGNCVILRHNNGYTTLYMHMSKFRRGQRIGQHVRQKDVIGYVGMTGLATGPHLHFGLKYHGHYIDPLKVKMARTRVIPKKHRAAFDAVAKDMTARLDSIEVL